jgi:putative NADH-flavin reductase
MKIVVFGATGRVGKLVSRELVRRGHDVTVFVHSTQPEDEDTRQVSGDIYDRESVEKALAGQNAIVCTLSSWKTEKHNVLSTAMQSIVPAAEKAGIERLVSVTGQGAGIPGEKVGPFTRLGRAAALLVFPKVQRDGEDHIAILAASKLNWTVVRSSLMTDGDSEAYILHGRSGDLTISRHAVARAMADLVESGEWPRRAPFTRKP